MQNAEEPITKLLLGYVSIFGFYYYIYKLGQLSDWTFKASDTYEFAFWFNIALTIPLIIILFISFFKVSGFLFQQGKTASKKFIVFASFYLTFSSFLFLSAFSFTVQYTLQYSIINIFCLECKKITVEKILTNYKNDDITNEVKNYINIWDELLDAKTDAQLKKALVKSIINSDCMLYAFREYNLEDALINMFSVKDDIMKSFSSDGIKYIKAHVLAETYPIGFINDNIDNYISKKTNVYNDDEQENLCKYNNNTEIIFQELFQNSDFKEIYNNLKL